MYFSDVCEKCNNQIPVQNYCQNCMSISKKAYSNWAKINIILDVFYLFLISR